MSNMVSTPKISTSLAILNCIKNITEEIKRKKIVRSIYLDFAKAFDSINHQLLSIFFNDMALHQKLIDCIKSYFGNRKIRTK